MGKVLRATSLPQRANARRRQLLGGLAGLPVALNACAKQPACGLSTVAQSKDTISISATDKSFKTIGAAFFGFNYELFEVQRSFWDESTNRPNASALEWMKAFPGAVYRFPGGSMANQYDWLAGMGEPAKRPEYDVYDWAGPWRNLLGPREYLEWVRAVDGEAWYIVNISGRYKKELSLAQLGDETRQLVKAIREIDPDPGRGILRWELGNELDRDVYQWRPEKYVAHARSVGQALREVDQDTGIVLMLQEYASLQKSAGISDAEYNGLIINSLRDLSIEYSMHLYYDGPPAGPPIPFRVGKLCDTVAMLDKDDALAKARIWITEHGRWPEEVRGTKWETQWFKTANLAAGLAVADMMIAATQLPRVDSAFIHSIHGSPGPWPLLHRQADGSFRPSAVYWAARVLREHLQAEVLPTRTASTNHAGYAGQYDVRATVLASADRRAFSVWAVNRLARPAQVELAIGPLAGRRVTVRLDYIGGQSPEADNYRDADTVVMQNEQRVLAFDANGVATTSLPPTAVAAFSIGAATS